MLIDRYDITAAKEIAAQATEQYIQENGENPFNCGFSWVEIKGARGNFSKMLKSMGFKKRYEGPGLYLWNPGGNRTQDMSAKLAGSMAFAKELRKFGVQISVHQRLD